MEINRLTSNSQNVVDVSSNDVFPKKTDIPNNKSSVEREKPDIKVARKDLDSSVNKANKIFYKNNTHLQFKIHDATKDVIVKIIDDETGETLKEIPSEKFVDMMSKICEVAGIFVDEKR